MDYFVKFYPDNYTDNVRTPWAGNRLVNLFKSGLVPNLPERIGEFWEFSTCPELPSRCMLPSEGEFSAVLRENAEHWLSQKHRDIWGHDTPLLIKYIDAAQDLSLQLHPPLKHTNLEDGECGKMEFWYILHTEDNAGIYLGLKEGVSRDLFVQTVIRHGNVKSLLNFIPVHEGDVFVIPPCTIHALGKNVTVLEPQLIVPGKSAVSMRLYDWERRYDALGNLCETGKPRRLHFESALPFIDFHTISDNEIHRIYAPYLTKQDHLNCQSIDFAPCLSSSFLYGTGRKIWSGSGELTAVLVLKGELDIQVNDKTYHLRYGESGAIAASAKDIVFDCRDAVVNYMYCLPERFQEMC